MNEIIIADAAGVELRSMLFSSYDFEVGDEENSFQITILRSEWNPVTIGSRMYIPGTEFGGIYRSLETNTQEGTISTGGLTWRGMLKTRILEPPAGQDYAKDNGELNAIIKARVEAAFPNMFTGVTISTGVSVNYQYNRYVSLYDGLKAMLKSKGYRLDIAYDQTLAKVVVQALPIVDYSDNIEYSSDMRTNYIITMNGTGVNHLICLGSGELKNRTVVNLYCDANGNISRTQTFTNENEIAAVYDYAGAALNDLIQSGTEQLKTLRSINTFQIDLETSDDIAVGDIVGGRDYVSGMSMKAPVSGKIARWNSGTHKIEYTLSDDITVSVEE